MNVMCRSGTARNESTAASIASTAEGFIWPLDIRLFVVSATQILYPNNCLASLRNGLRAPTCPTSGQHPGRVRGKAARPEDGFPATPLATPSIASDENKRSLGGHQKEG